MLKMADKSDKNSIFRLEQENALHIYQRARNIFFNQVTDDKKHIHESIDKANNIFFNLNCKSYLPNGMYIMEDLVSWKS